MKASHLSLISQPEEITRLLETTGQQARARRALELRAAFIDISEPKEIETMSSSPTTRMKIGDFLLRRLEEAGIRHLFGVPGDYNLGLLQQLYDTGALQWVGTTGELTASYAADGYARLNGLGALLVTNGVGALSAINGVGGSYSEHVPVICICGSIPLRSIDRGLGMHHTMADGTFDHFLDAYAPVTVAQTRLTPRNAATEIGSNSPRRRSLAQ